MLSLEPATITDRRYPLLFQQGETAYGVPIADGQHPTTSSWNWLRSMTSSWARTTLLSFYFAPVGDPAIGPTAYPHRASAFEDPVATLGHHQEDSTHISDDVVTVGLTYRIVRIEGFRFPRTRAGRESLDHRSGRHGLVVYPIDHSAGEELEWAVFLRPHQEPGGALSTENQERMTASVMYNRPLRNGNWASTLLWGRTRSLEDNAIFNSYLLDRRCAFIPGITPGLASKTPSGQMNLILGENPLPPGFIEEPIGHVQAYTFGYDHDFDLIPHVASAIGAQFTTYGVPDMLKPIYGSHPLGVALFMRLRPFSGKTDDRAGRGLLPAPGGAAGRPADRTGWGDGMRRNQKPSGA